MAQITLHPLMLYAEQGHGQKHTYRQGGGGRQGTGRGAVSRDDGEQIGDGDIQEDGADEGLIRFRVLVTDFADLIADDADHHFHKTLPARRVHIAAQAAGGQPGKAENERHHQPGEHQGGIELE